MKEPRIRFAAKNDLESLVHLCELHAIFEKADYNKENKVKILNQYLFSKTPSLFCLVVEYGAKIIGYATYMKQFSTWDCDFYLYMDCLFLTEESRGFGIGKKLMNKIKEEALKNNCLHIQWQTPKFNKRAIEFYQILGAERKSKERFFWKVI